MASGSRALYSNTIGNLNTANGVQALLRNTTGTENTANGFRALYSNTTGNGNMASGSHALYSNTTRYGNTANGNFRFHGDIPWEPHVCEACLNPGRFDGWVTAGSMLGFKSSSQIGVLLFQMLVVSWNYYRHVEMVDFEIGRILQALDDSGQTANTLIVFTSDHGEGLAGHQMVTKNFFYESALKVPLVISWPGNVPENKEDKPHFVNGLDFVPTFCDYAGMTLPKGALGKSLRPLLEGNSVEWRPFTVSELAKNTGRMVRTEQYKYVHFVGDPVEQLFDMKTDAGETKNLAASSEKAPILDDHRNLLKDWEKRLDPVQGKPNPRSWT